MFCFFSVLHFLFFIALYLGFLRPPLELYNERIFLALTAQFLFVRDDCFRRWQLDSLLFDVSFRHKKEAIFVFISSSLFSQYCTGYWHICQRKYNFFKCIFKDTVVCIMNMQLKPAAVIYISLRCSFFKTSSKDNRSFKVRQFLFFT